MNAKCSLDLIISVIHAHKFLPKASCSTPFVYVSFTKISRNLSKKKTLILPRPAVGNQRTKKQHRVTVSVVALGDLKARKYYDSCHHTADITLVGVIMEDDPYVGVGK